MKKIGFVLLLGSLVACHRGLDVKIINNASSEISQVSFQPDSATGLLFSKIASKADVESKLPLDKRFNRADGHYTLSFKRNGASALEEHYVDYFGKGDGLDEGFRCEIKDDTVMVSFK